MSSPSTTRYNESAYDLLDRWLAHREQEADAAGVRDHAAPVVDVVEQVPVDTGPVAAAVLGFETPGRAGDEGSEPVRTEEEFEEFAHPVIGGAAGAPPSLGPETTEVSAVLQPDPTRSPVTVDALAAAPPPLAPGSVPGLVLFSPRRGARNLLTGAAALLAGAAGGAGYLAWQAPTRTSIGVAAGLGVALLLVWRLRRTTSSTEITVEHGVLRVVQGHSVHRFPLVGSHPPIEVLGDPRRRSWRVLIQRRGMPPYVITRRMVDPVEFTEVLRHFRPDV